MKTGYYIYCWTSPDFTFIGTEKCQVLWDIINDYQLDFTKQQKDFLKNKNKDKADNILLEVIEDLFIYEKTLIYIF